MISLLLDNTYNYYSPYALMNDQGNKTFTYGKMLKQDDCADFICAMLTEVEDHFQHDHFELVLITRAGKNKLIRFVWSFK